MLLFNTPLRIPPEVFIISVPRGSLLHSQLIVHSNTMCWPPPAPNAL